ncbi:putative Gcp-like domain, peptidase M22, tRNA N6-adenosine threonylcarbamoyltransferase, TsaD [Septoria linicola]|nr:putative Gcp-like domain, peptidase M22, tRNA N6-adenosine threonylcarbamoyltransferase, TsaD [Septoria linicola]
MRSNLAVGLDTAKGLAVGLDVPFLGIHHMQAHALTIRLVKALASTEAASRAHEPAFPFLTVLASGGHTMLITSSGLNDHSLLAETGDIALGDCLDKSARLILPSSALKAPFGQALEDFAFPRGLDGYEYVAPTRRQEELECRMTRWGWALRPPFAESKGGLKTTRRMAFSFAGLLTAVQRLFSRPSATDGNLAHEAHSPEDITEDERRDMAREVQRVTFEHLTSRLLLHLNSAAGGSINTVVVSGGVASNKYLRHVMRQMLDARGHPHVQLEFPLVSLCTDNALMIAWAALEMYNAGFRSELDVQPIRKWSMDPKAEDGGILGVGGWIQVARTDG